MTRAEIVADLPQIMRLLRYESSMWPHVLEWVLSACQAMGRGASFEYHNGMFQEPAITLNDWKEPVLDESRRGYASSVGGYVAVDENGEEVFFATPAECVVSMLGQLKSALEAK